MRNPGFRALLLLTALLQNCVRQPELTLDIHVTSAGKPATDAEIRLDGKVVGRTGSTGEFTFAVHDNQADTLHLWASSNDPDHMKMPATIDVATVLPLFESRVDVKLELLNLPAPRHPVAETTPTPAEMPIQIVEADLPAEPDATLTPTPAGTPRITLATPTPPPDIDFADALASLVKADAPTPAPPGAVATPDAPHQESEAHSEGAHPLFKDDFAVNVISENKPLAGAQIFMGRNGQNSLEYLGSTDAKGELTSTLPPGLRGETMLVRHPCCVPLLRPFAAGSGAKTISVELAKGGAHDFVAVNYAYGVARGIEGAQLHSSLGHIDTANPQGFLLASGKSVSTKYKVTCNECIVHDVESKENLNPATPEKPMLAFFATKKPPRPTIGILELTPANGGDIKNEMAWRRLRRDFQSRFLQALNFKPITPAEVHRLAASVGVEDSVLANKGWEFSPLKYNFDALVVFDRRASEAVDAISLRIVDRTGRILSTLTNGNKGGEPEQIAGKIYAQFLADFPFEGAALSVKNGEAQINFGSADGRALRVGQTVVFFASGTDRSAQPDRLQGSGKIIAIGEHVSTVRLNSNPDGRIEAGNIAIRVSGEGALEYADRQGAKTAN